jgi:cupin 2 domain-containing protein
MVKQNLFTDIPANVTEEIFQTLVQSDNVRIERIISQGQASPENFWYDQQQNEWVVVLKGSAAIRFENGNLVELHEGHFVNIPAHEKHRVEWTDSDSVTVWLAVFY